MMLLLRSLKPHRRRPPPHLTIPLHRRHLQQQQQLAQTTATPPPPPQTKHHHHHHRHRFLFWYRTNITTTPSTHHISNTHISSTSTTTPPPSSITDADVQAVYSALAVLSVTKFTSLMARLDRLRQQLLLIDMDDDTDDTDGTTSSRNVTFLEEDTASFLKYLRRYYPTTLAATNLTPPHLLLIFLSTPTGEFYERMVTQWTARRMHTWEHLLSLLTRDECDALYNTLRRLRIADPMYVARSRQTQFTQHVWKLYQRIVDRDRRQLTLFLPTDAPIPSPALTVEDIDHLSLSRLKEFEQARSGLMSGMSMRLGMQLASALPPGAVHSVALILDSFERRARGSYPRATSVPSYMVNGAPRPEHMAREAARSIKKICDIVRKHKVAMTQLDVATLSRNLDLCFSAFQLDSLRSAFSFLHRKDLAPPDELDKLRSLTEKRKKSNRPQFRVELSNFAYRMLRYLDNDTLLTCLRILRAYHSLELPEDQQEYYRSRTVLQLMQCFGTDAPEFQNLPEVVDHLTEPLIHRERRRNAIFGYQAYVAVARRKNKVQEYYRHIGHLEEMNIYPWLSQQTRAAKLFDYCFSLATTTAQFTQLITSPVSTYKVYVENLKPNITPYNLVDMFQRAVGEVEGVEIFRDPLRLRILEDMEQEAEEDPIGRSIRERNAEWTSPIYGFVYFSTAEARDRALFADCQNIGVAFQDFNARTRDINEITSLFVGNLPRSRPLHYFVDVLALLLRAECPSSFTVSSFREIVDQKTGVYHIPYLTLAFESHWHAQQALEALTVAQIDGYRVDACWSAEMTTCSSKYIHIPREDVHDDLPWSIKV